MRFSPLALTLVLLFQTAAAGAPGTCDLVLVNARGERITLGVEIARTPEERNLGLMHRRYLPEASGMLFAFEYEQVLAFWMKNTHIPLSIAYIDRRGVIREIYDMKPLDDTLTYPSRNPAMYALEVNAGWFERNGITRGCRVHIDGCLGQ